MYNYFRFRGYWRYKMKGILDIVKSNLLFANMDVDEIETVLKCANAQVANFNDNQILFEKNHKVKKLGIVVEGALNLVSQKYSGSRVIVTKLRENDLFGEALIYASGARSPYDLISSGDSKVLLIPYKIFSKICFRGCDHHNQLIHNMLTILSDKIVMLNNKMTILNADTLRGRIATYLLFLQKDLDTMTFDLPMNRQDLAEFLNVKRPSLSRELSNMQRDKIIEIYRSSVKIIDLDKLRELAD